MKTLIFFAILFSVFSSQAEVKVYQETDNEGMYKYERFASIEKHLIELGTAMNKLEAKLDENTKKMKGLEDVVNAIKAEEAKRVQEQLGEKPTDNKKIEAEMKKLKDDYISLKDKDIERIRLEIRDLSEAVKLLKK